MNKKGVWPHESFFIDDEMLWFVPYYYGILCGYNMNEHRITRTKLLTENIKDIDRYINVIKYNNFIISIPSYENVVKVFDVNNDDIIDYETIKRNAEKYFPAIILNDKALIFPFEAESIIEISFKKGTPVFEEYPVSEKGFVACQIIGESVYLVKQNGGIYTYNTESHSISNIYYTDAIFVDISVEDERLYLVDLHGNIYIYDIEKKIISKIYESSERYHSIAIREGFVYAFPEKEGMYIDKISIDKRSIEKRIQLSNCALDSEWKWMAFSRTKVKNRKIYVTNIKRQEFLVIDENDNVLYHIMECPELKYDEKILVLEATNSKECLFENLDLGIDLSFFLKAIQ